MIDKTISILMSFLILGNGLIIRKLTGTWLSPTCLYCIFWFGYTFFPLIFLIEIPINPIAIAFIFLTTMTLSLSSLFFDWRIAFKKNQKKIIFSLNLLKSSFLKKVFYSLSCLSVLFIIIDYFSQGTSINDVVFNFFETTATYTNKRYEEELITTIFGQFSFILSYVSLALGGLIFFHFSTSSKKILVLFLSFVPSAFQMILQSSKGALLLGIFIFYAGVLISKIYKNDFILFTWKTFKVSIVAFLIIFPLLIISFLSRGLYDFDTYDVNFVFIRLKHNFFSYAFGHLYAFSDWFSFYIGEQSTQRFLNEPQSYGFYTFMSLFKILGSTKKVPLGVFDEYYKFDDLLTTNIYTIYRGFILDFGLVGTLIFMFIQGLFFNLIFFLILSFRSPAFTASIFIFMLGYFYTSFIISLLIWNSIYASLILLGLILWVNNLKYTHRK